MEERTDRYDDIVFREEMPKMRRLRWWDVLIITAVMFGSAILSSTEAWMELSVPLGGALSQSYEEATEELPVFTPYDDLFSLVDELFILLVVWAYLKVRRFDFSVWKVKASFRGSLLGIVIFCITGLLFDGWMMAVYGFDEFAATLGGGYIISVILDSTMIMFFFSVVNGFFEEIFFLGVCTAVDEKCRIPYFIFSLIVRASFHTYQGIVSAVGVGLILGIVNMAAWKKLKGNMYPVMFSHMLCDVIGLTFLGMF